MLAIAVTGQPAELHVDKRGRDTNPGTRAAPLHTIQRAADLAQPGDVVTVHSGVYRERVTPPRGGESDAKRILYQAAKGEKVEVKGSEVVTGWEEAGNGVWRLTLPNSFFGKYNPYKDVLAGDWYHDQGRTHHTGEVYLNGKSLYETSSLEGVLNPQSGKDALDKNGSTYTWYCESDATHTRIHANFHKFDPNKELVEINVRDSCFYPSEPGRNHITIRGFRLSQAATQWAAPTAEQIGLIGTHWSKGWIIENNVVSDSKCVGITLGKDRRSGHNVWSKDPARDGAIHYNEVIVKALQGGWSKEGIGSHIVRNNTIYNCEQAGICGSLGAAFSRITHNHIFNIWTKRGFGGVEIAGIKIHGAIDVLIRNNRLHNVNEGIWLDWMAQGARVTGNLCYQNNHDFFAEVDHGPYLVDNNIFLSDVALWNWSQGGAFVHNLVAGKIIADHQDERRIPYFLPHSTEVVGLKDFRGGDDRFYNNIFVGKGAGLDVCNSSEVPTQADGNAYFTGAKPFTGETHQLEQTGFDPELKIVDEGREVYLHIVLDPSPKSLKTALVTTERLGKPKITGGAYENPDGSSLKINTDYFGNQRNMANPSVGPFENPGVGKLKLKVW